MLGKLPGLNVFRSVERFPDTLIHPSIAIMKISSSICFLNVSYIRKFFHELLTKSTQKIHVVILDWSPVCFIDVSGASLIKHIIEQAQMHNFTFLHAQLDPKVAEQLKNCGIFDKILKEHFFWDLNDAVLFACKLQRDIEEKEKKDVENLVASQKEDLQEVKDQMIEEKIQIEEVQVKKKEINQKKRERKMSFNPVNKQNTSPSLSRRSPDFSPLVYGDDYEKQVERKKKKCIIM